MLNISSLIIETTRRCQFTCAHCLRGKAQNLDVSLSHIDSLLDQVDYINTITFTGGEPSLNTEAIGHTLEACKERGVEVGSFYIATNGYKVGQDFVLACLRWYAYCEEKGDCLVQVSNDGYHAEEGQYETELLDGLSFFNRKHTSEAEYYDPINEGLASENGIGIRNNAFPAVLEVDDNYVETVYLSCKGAILPDCDMSYETQEDNLLCTVDKLTEYVETIND